MIFIYRQHNSLYFYIYSLMVLFTYYSGFYAFIAFIVYNGCDAYAGLRISSGSYQRG